MAKKIITISRQFGSGGRSIAKELAGRLGYDYYDKEIIESVAEKTGFSEQFIAEKGERSPGRTIFSYGFDSGSMMPGVMYGMSANDYIWTEQWRSTVRPMSSPRRGSWTRTREELSITSSSRISSGALHPTTTSASTAAPSGSISVSTSLRNWRSKPDWNKGDILRSYIFNTSFNFCFHFVNI